MLNLFKTAMIVSRFITIASALFDIFHENKKIEQGKITKDQFGRYLKEKLESLGPTFIKVGQILSLRPDLVPLEYCMPLRELLDRTDEIGLEEVMLILRKELGTNPHKVFSHISKKPIASASVAQVHKGKLQGKDEYVVMKVKKPGIEKLIRTDVKILRFLNMLFYNEIQKKINSRELIDDLGTVLDKELNFAKEGTNVEKFREIFKNIKFVKTPEIYWPYTTKNLLVMEFIPGVSLNKVFHQMDIHPEVHAQETVIVDGITIHKRKLALRLIKVVAHSVFDAGFFHADPHPANIILTADEKVAYIDFGMVGDLLSDEKILFRELVYCISTKDEGKIMKLLVDYNKSIGYPVPAANEYLQIKHLMHDLIMDFTSSDQRNFPITKFMYSLGSMAFKFNFPPPAFLMLISKQIFTLEGLAGYLIPDLNIIKEFQPYVYSFKTKDSLRKFTNEKIAKFIDDAGTLGMNLPESLNIIMNNLRKDGLIDMPTRVKSSKKAFFFVFLLYAVFIAFFLPVFVVNTTLLIVLWGSIITAILILYLIFYKDG